MEQFDDTNIELKDSTPIEIGHHNVKNEKFAKNINDMTLEEFLESDELVLVISNDRKCNNSFIKNVLYTLNTFSTNGVDTVEEFVDNLLNITHGIACGLNKTTFALSRGIINTITLKER